MGITSLQMKIAAEKGVSTATQYVTPLKLFANSFRNQEIKKGSAVTVPVFSYDAENVEFNKTSNNYGSGTTNATGVDIILNKHFVYPISYADTDFDECDVDFWKDQGAGICKVLGEACVGEVNSKLLTSATEANVKFSAADAKSKATAANLFKIAIENNLTPGNTIAVFNPTLYANILGTLDAAVYGTADAIKFGMIPNLFGFKAVVCDKGLNAELNGMLIDENALGIAARVPHVDISAYKEVGSMSDEATGYPVQFRRYTEPSDGENKLAGTMIFGSAILNKKGLIGLIEA